MDPSRVDPAIITATRALFWRLAASVTGAALERKSMLRQALNWAPIVLFGCLAFVLGRLAGELLRLVH
jgi:hypothetical protein